MGKPNKRNFCGGNFADWLEVNLIPECNGRCSWCVEKNGYHPETRATVSEMTEAIKKTGKNNIILLGGEPTLYPELKRLIANLSGLNIYITTNGSRLTAEFAKDVLNGVKGINVSMHSEHPDENKVITGIGLNLVVLKEVFEILNQQKAVIRLNCNLIRGYVDCEDRINAYLKLAKALDVDSVRFAELKDDEENFVNLFSIYGDKYGINNEPFGLGCNTDAQINGVHVNFRQMCGLQTKQRAKPYEPDQIQKKVLYYDGIVYNGWQKGNSFMDTRKTIKNIVKDYLSGKLTEQEAVKILGYFAPEKTQEEITALLQSGHSKIDPEQEIRDIAQKVAEEHGMGGGCHY